VHVYATAGRGFETPTLNELAYRPNGQTGLNLELDPARSANYEVGVKTRSAEWGLFNVALFQTDTRDEIVTQTNVGGRSTFQNAGSSRRRGVEAAWTHEFGHDLRAQLAYTWLDARYREAIPTCTGTPCTTPNATIPAGNRIPGIARQWAYAAFGWAPPQGWRAGIEARGVGGVFVNDANSDAAERYVTANVNVGYVTRLGAWDLAGFGRIDNLFDKNYAGSVIVNEGNARYFEPAPGRTWTVGLTGSLRF
jgi:iron complex outermembrane receptor protein